MIKITVIITAFNRKEFLIKAIESALNQSLNREYYEVIVLKNFIDESIDSFIKEHKLLSIYSQEKLYPRWIFEAVKVSNGDIICFLEDDDLYKDNHLEAIYVEFSHYEKLGFLKTGFELYSEIDDIKIYDVFKKVYKNIDVTSLDDSLVKLLKIQRYGINAIISAIGIKKSILIKAESFLTNFYLFDYFLPYFALFEGYDLIALSDVSIRYRIGDSWTHIISGDIQKNIIQKDNLLKNVIKDYNEMKYIFKSKKHFLNAIDYQIVKLNIDLGTLSNFKRKPEVILLYIYCSIIELNAKRIAYLFLFFIYRFSGRRLMSWPPK